MVQEKPCVLTLGNGLKVKTRNKCYILERYESENSFGYDCVTCMTAIDKCSNQDDIEIPLNIKYISQKESVEK